jgi:hypothetical protein
MSARVLGGGHAHELLESNFIEAAPQVHLHFLTGEDEYNQLGYAKLELCCHGCGAATLIYYNEEGHTEADVQRHMKMRDDFTLLHARCPNRGYEKSCPDHRTSLNLVDMRRGLNRGLRSQTRQVVRYKAPGNEALSSKVTHANASRAAQRERRNTRDL